MVKKKCFDEKEQYTERSRALNFIASCLIYADYYKIKELILDIHYEFFEGEKETEEDNKKER